MSTPQVQAGERRDAAQTPDFDRLSAVYRWLEWLSFGPWLSMCRRTFLSRLTGHRHALLLGDGDGRFTAALLVANPAIEIDALDASPAMLRALERRVGPGKARIRTCAADAREWRPSGASQYDLVVTHFFLDCLTTEEIGSLARAIRPALCPGALWVVSEFSVPGTRFGRLVAAPLVGALYRAFGLLTGLSIRRLPDYAAEFRKAGLTLLETRPRLRGLLVSELWAFGNRPPRPASGAFDCRSRFTGQNVTTVLKSAR